LLIEQIHVFWCLYVLIINIEKLQLHVNFRVLSGVLLQTEVSIGCQKTPEVGIRRILAYTPNTPLALFIRISAKKCKMWYSYKEKCSVSYCVAPKTWSGALPWTQLVTAP